MPKRFEVTSPDGRKFEVTGPDGSTQEQAIAYIQANMPQKPETPKPAEPSALQQAGRQAGLVGRNLIEGVGDLASLPSDALFGLVNYIQAARGEKMPFKLARESISDFLTDAGLPVPETREEKFASAVEKGLTGGAGTILMGRMLAGAPAAAQAAMTPGALQSAPAPALQVPGAVATSPVPASGAQAVGQMLSTAPGAQAAGTLGGVTGQTAVAAAGGGPVLQTLGGLAGGMTAGMAPTLGGSATRGAVAAADPFRRSGQETIAGAALRQAATDPDAAISQLDDTAVMLAGRAGTRPKGEIVPGSAPTTGQAARDPGLAFFENRMRAINAAPFAERMSQQNAARQTMLDSIADGGLPQKVVERTKLREAVTADLRDKAFSQAAGKRVATEKIIAGIDDLMSKPDNAGQSVQSALKQVRKWIAEPEGGTQTTDGITVSAPLDDAMSLYAVRKEINRILEGRYVGADESVLRYAGGQLSKVRGLIDDAITEVAPDWKRYLTKYAQLSKPIERTEVVQGIREKTGLSAPDIQTGRDFISQPKWRNVVTRSMPELKKQLTKGQIEKLQAIGADLDRGAAASSAANVRPPGSDTAANLATSGQISVAYVIGRALGKGPNSGNVPMLGMAKPLAFLYKQSDDQIRQMIVDAMLDPKLAARLMRKGTAQNVQAFVDSLQKAKATQLGSAQATGESRE